LALGIVSASSLSPAAAQTVLPSFPGLNFQTSGPQRGPGIGDWYTTATSASPDRVHRFFISITPTDLAAAGGSVVITVEDAGSGGPRDETDGAALGSLGGTPDPTRFELSGPTGGVIATQTLTPNTIATDRGRTITFPAITAPGVYTVTSITGAGPIANDTTLELNNDDNGFRIVVPVTELLIGQFQGTFQQNTGAAVTIPFFFLVGPGTGSLFLRNFDLDGGGSITYTRPSGVTTAGTTSVNAVWNGGGDLNNGGDTLPGLAPIADAGRWGLTLGGYTNNNQTLLETNSNLGRLPLFDAPPRRAGNFTITPDTTRTTTIGTAVDHPFTVTNNFFTSDIINLALLGTAANYTVQLLDGAGNPLTDIDADGVLDTGILAVGETRNFILRVTPNAGAPPTDITQITGTSLIDRVIRQQAGTGAPVPQSVTKTTTIPGTTGTIGNIVFSDLNGNGVQDPGELGIGGVTVTLRDGAGNIVGTTVTDANGNYSFTNLPAGNYTLSLSNTPPGFSPTNNPGSVTLAAGQTIDTVDFGLAQANAAIGNFVFNDPNNNGVQDPGEIGIGGVTLTLRDGAGNALATTTTDASGNYLFPNLLAGTYTVTATPPAGFVGTTPNPQTVTLAAGQTIDTVDFGLRQIPGTIGDRVFNDPNNNGILDPGETGVGGATVTLRDAAGNIVATATTDTNGNYQFPNLPPGNYTVTVTPPTGFVNTTPTTLPVNLAPGQIIDTIDFGLRQPLGAIGDRVFNDLNGNGVQDPGEPNLPGVTVTLNGIDANGNTVNLTTTTDANGNYQFANILAGNYTVTVTPPATFNATTPNPQNVTLAPGQTIDTVDFGLRQTPGTIGDRVFNDIDANGIQTGAERGIASVTVTLLNAVGAVVATTVTDANGNYQFTNIAPGNYTVTLTNPPGFVNTTPATLPVVLPVNTSIDTIDFGLRQPPATIGDLVFTDANNNGIQDPGEPGLANATLTLRDSAGNVVATTTTNAAGNYQFINVPPGSYTVTVTPPPGFNAVPPNPQTVTVTPEQTLTTVDFPLRQIPGTLGDRIFNDPNGNGILDPGETGVGGIVVVLRNAAGAVIATTVSDANGNYQFNNLPAGSYTVELTLPAGFSLTTPASFAVNLASGQIITNLDFGLRTAAPQRLRLVKRITNVTRNGVPLSGLNFNAFQDDPGTIDDNAPGWAQLAPVGLIRIDGSPPLQSGDELTYTIYFLSDGPAPVLAVNLCDQIDASTSLVANSSQIRRGNVGPVAGGTLLNPLAPLPPNTACLSESNPNGTALFDLADIPNTAGNNFGFVRFRVRLN
jgi:protocatechuate 3,4-dioxygenase beta subunit